MLPTAANSCSASASLYSWDQGRRTFLQQTSSELPLWNSGVLAALRWRSEREMGRSRISFPGRPSSRPLLADTTGAEGGGAGGGRGEPLAARQPPVRPSGPAWGTGREDEATGRVGDGKGLQAPPSAEALRQAGGEDLRSAAEVTSQTGTPLSEMLPFRSLGCESGRDRETEPQSVDAFVIQVKPLVMLPYTVKGRLSNEAGGDLLGRLLVGDGGEDDDL